jgi:hypothetical protein
MKKNLFNLFSHIKNFFTNRFWQTFLVWIILGLTLLAHAAIWYFYFSSLKSIIGITQIFYSSGAIILNLFLANLVYEKESLASFILLGVALLIQILFIIFLKVLLVPHGF